MEERNDSWYHLQDHSTPPPPEMFEKLRQLADPATGNNGGNFRLLLDHPVQPPAKLHSAIMDSILLTNRRKKRWLSYTAAAACLLIIAIGLVLHRSEHHQKPDIAINSVHKAPTIAPADALANDSVATASAKAAGADSAAGPAIQLSAPALTMDGERFALTDDNPLLTFTSYRYADLGTRIRNRKGESVFHIQLDQYTNIALSPAMSLTLRDLYDTRTDGTPSRKARKTRERLEKWNAEDKKQFELHHAVNPLDPVDLGEFLFPPLFSFGRRSGSVLPTGDDMASATKASKSVATPKNLQGIARDSSSAEGDAPLTVSYLLTLVTKKTNAGIGETYNGGIQTLFMQNGYGRLRLASLMRIQSVLITPENATVSIFTESEKPRQKIALSPSQWSAYNDKYAGMTRDLLDDSVVILGYRCKKAMLTLHDGRHITAWYTPGIQPQTQALIESEFTGIPGLVLRYEYTCRRKTVRYTATNLSRRPIASSIFIKP